MYSEATEHGSVPARVGHVCCTSLYATCLQLCEYHTMLLIGQVYNHVKR